MQSVAPLLFLGLLLAAPAGALEWDRVADERVPVLVTLDEDGDERRTKLWLVVVDGEGYVRTNDSRWFRNIQRDPRVQLEIGGGVHRLRAVPVTEPILRGRIEGAMRHKYGWQDFLIHPFGTPDANMLHLQPRAE